MSIIEFKDVYKEFQVGKRSKKTTITALKDISLSIDHGDIFAVIGYSGAGKSTLVRLINGLEKATSGSIIVDGRQIVGISEHELNAARKDIGMIFQQFNLFTTRTVAGNVEYPLKEKGVPVSERKQRVKELLNFVGLTDRAGNYPEQLSGGQKQRVGIARALATNPKILLADESTSALDPDTTHEVLALLKEVNKTFGITVVVITHEMEVVKELANKVAILSKGEVVEQGSVFDVFSHPKTQTGERFVSTVIQNKLTDHELALLRQTRDGRIFQFEVAEKSGIGDKLSNAVRRGLDFEIVFGAISELEDKPFGRLAIQLKGDDSIIDETIKNLQKTTSVEEVFYPKNWDKNLRRVVDSAEANNLNKNAELVGQSGGDHE